MEALDEENQGGYSELSTDRWQLLCKDITIPEILPAQPSHDREHIDLAFLKCQ